MKTLDFLNVFARFCFQLNCILLFGIGVLLTSHMSMILSRILVEMNSIIMNHATIYYNYYL